MSRSTPESNSRGLSEDTWCGKRSVEDDERSTLSEPKRVRRGGSSPRVLEEPAQDFIVVSSRKVHRKDSQPPERGVLLSQSSSRVSSPLSSAPSRMTDDCGEMAQKAMEAWQNSLGVSNVAANGEDATTANLPPTSPRSSTGGSNQAREWLETQRGPIEKPFRTPLPAQKEPRHVDASSPRPTNSPRTEQQEQWPDRSQSSSNARTPSLQSSMNINAPIQATSNVQSVMNIDAPVSTTSDDGPQPKDPILMHDRNHSAWYSRDESRQLPPLPTMNSQLAGIRRDSLTQSIDGQHAPVPHHGTGGLEGGLNTFSSNFSVLTTDNVQRGGRIGKRRGRKPAVMAGPIRAEERPANTAETRVESEDAHANFVRGVRHDDTKGSSRSPPSRHAPDDRHPITSTANMNIHSPLVNSPHVQPSKFTTPPITRAAFQPPPVSFTLDNTFESSLPAEEVQAFIDSFKQNTNILLPPILDKEASSYPIEVVMWQGLLDFYKWFGENARTKEIGPLMFELLDIHWQEERSFVVPEGSLSYFRIIKQYIWDFYWLAVSINKGPTRFRVLVKRFILHGQASPDAFSHRPITDPSSRPTSRHAYARQLPDPLPSASRPMSPRQRQGISPMSRDAILQSSPRPSNPFDGRGVEASQQIPGQPPRSPEICQVRTSYDQAMLRERAHGFTIDRRDIEILEHESTVLDKLPYKTGAEVCGVVIDKRSGNGMVAITGKGYITLNVKTGIDEPGDRYQDVTIQPKQTCMLHGRAVVLFYRRRVTVAQQTSFRPEHGQPQRPRTGSDVDIIVRLQIDGNGKYSHAFDKSVLRPKVTTTEFFSWFAGQSGHCLPQGPSFLKFTFKDAMPTPKSTEIARGNEDHFTYMRKDVKVQCEKAKKFMEDLKEFVILVTVPGWMELNVDEEEEW